MEIFIINCSVDSNGTPVNFGCPVIVDDEIYSRCVNGHSFGIQYFDENDIESCVSFVNSQFYDKTEAWRDIVAPVSPYLRTDIFNYFGLFFPKFYLAPDGFFPQTEDKRYSPVIYDGENIPGNVVQAVPISVRLYGNLRGNLLQNLGYYLDNPFTPDRFHMQVRPIIFSESQITGGEINLTVNNVIGTANISLDKGRVDGELGISGSLFTTTISQNETAFWSGKAPPLPPEPDTDPFAPGGNTEPEGGGGDFDDTSTPVNFPELPELSATQAGFITLFNPTIYQLSELASYMWSDLFDIEGWKKIFANPMDAILGLSIVPVNVPSSGTQEVKVGNIGTGVSINVASSQYVRVDCGTVNVNEYWGAYLDYDPYTKAEIYLPYVGTHALSVDDIMGKTVHVVYHVDILSGACCAYVKCGESVLYSFAGQCSCSIPITGNDWTNVVNGVLSIAGSIGSMVATGGATAPMAIGTMASAAVNSFKPSVEKSGSLSGMGGILGIQYPYLILTRPRQALPAQQNKYTGYPAFITVSLSECSGFTEIENIHLDNIPATQAEISEIETLLKGGVIF